MLRPLIDQISGETSAANCMENVQMIIRHHRTQASPGYPAAAQKCLATLRQSGVEATITTYPATGLRQFLLNLTEAEHDSWIQFNQAHPGAAEIEDHLGYFQLLERLDLVKGLSR